MQMKKDHVSNIFFLNNKNMVHYGCLASPHFTILLNK